MKCESLLRLVVSTTIFVNDIVFVTDVIVIVGSFVIVGFVVLLVSSNCKDVIIVDDIVAPTTVKVVTIGLVENVVGSMIVVVVVHDAFVLHFAVAQTDVPLILLTPIAIRIQTIKTTNETGTNFDATFFMKTFLKKEIIHNKANKLNNPLPFIHRLCAHVIAHSEA